MQTVPIRAPENTLPPPGSTPGQLVFDCWKRLESLARRRFPGNDALAQEALLYVLDELQRDDWKRARAWQGQGRFVTFVTVLATRLLSDFSRRKFGYIRKPRWLARESDPVWHAAYQLLVEERYPRQAAAEILNLRYPERENRFIRQVLSTVQASCRHCPLHDEPVTTTDAELNPASPAAGPDENLEPGDAELADALRRCLDSRGVEPTPDVKALLARLAPLVQLTEEDRLLLRLHYLDGLPLRRVAELLHLDAAPYKRRQRLLAQLRAACRLAGLLEPWPPGDGSEPAKLLD